MKRPLFILSLGLCLLIGPSRGLTQEATRPAVHWGSFTKGFNLRESLSTAEDAMRSKGYELFERGGYIRIGGNNAVIVQVSCAPIDGNTTEITVSAFSTDSRTAELARNEIRSYIVGAAKL